MFSEFGLKKSLLDAIAAAGYQTPTPVQSQVIPEVLKNKDVIGCAQTGTGKTASFILPLIHKLSAGRTRARMPRALIIEPTRELAIQVGEAFVQLAKDSKLKHILLIGGHSMGAQEKGLAKEFDIIIATPGRLLDFIERGKVLLHGVEMLIIDEADRMMDMGFLPEIKSIVSKLSHKRQTLLFSATMPDEIKKLTKSILKDPTEIMVAPPAETAKTITQYQIQTNSRNKIQDLKMLLDSHPSQSIIVFLNRKKSATSLCSTLMSKRYSVGLLHGDLTQSMRTETLESFKKGEIKILIASDVAARGIDIENLDCVINFDVPMNPEDYVHRIGRTGRAGQLGTAFTFVTKEDQEIWAQIGSMTKDQVADYKLPKPKEKTEKPITTQKIEHPKGDVEGFGDHIPAFMEVSIHKPLKN